MPLWIRSVHQEDLEDGKLFYNNFYKGHCPFLMTETRKEGLFGCLHHSLFITILLSDRYPTQAGHCPAPPAGKDPSLMGGVQVSQAAPLLSCRNNPPL